MSVAAESILLVGRSVFLIENIILLYIFLTPKRSRGFQAVVLIATWVAIYLLRMVLALFSLDPLLQGYVLGSLYLIPCILIFKETFQAKVFVFYLNFSLTQLIFLIFMHIDRFLSPAIPLIYVLAGLLLELASLPLVNRYLKTPIRNILRIINQQKTAFTLFPVLSFLLLAYYGLQRTYLLSTFITLLLSTTLIIFSYYLIAIFMSAARHQQELEKISKTDSLTGLYNRRHMEQKIQEEYSRYQINGSEFALIIADIDYFKNINDVFGHDCGDNLLKLIVNDMSSSVRAQDTVARWGGEEFLLLLPVTNKDHAVKLAERIRKTVEGKKYDTGKKQVSVTLTLGVSIVRSEDTPDEMIKRADMALYYGKRKSRNCVILFDENEM